MMESVTSGAKAQSQWDFVAREHTVNGAQGIGAHYWPLLVNIR
jgi:hypothetical protein